MDVLELLENIEALDIETIAGDALRDNSGVIADLNASQMYQGRRSDGTEILPSYTPLTVFLKEQKGQVTDHVTLRDTGEFQQELYAEVTGDEIEYGSKNEKAEKLDKKYSTAKGSIFGLDEESRDELVTGFLEDSFYEKVHDELGI
jgi:hypothetical protein